MSTYNENSPSTPYFCGALMAVFAAIQNDKAVNEVNVNVIERFYASAMQTPALVLPRLSRMSVHYLEKIESVSKPRYLYYKNILQDISQKVDKIPSTLTLEQQSEFMLGYYQMSAHIYHKNPASENTAEQNEEKE